MDSECTWVTLDCKLSYEHTLIFVASSELKLIREVGMNFNPSGLPWTLWQEFTDSDVYSGVATVLVNNVNHLYLVNATTTSLTQWTWDYETADSGYSTSWEKGERQHCDDTACR